MSRISRLLLPLTLFLLAAPVLGQTEPRLPDDNRQPAPAEVSGHSEEDTSVDPIEGTQPSSETTDTETTDTEATDTETTGDENASLRAEAAKLRDEVARLQEALEQLRSDYKSLAATVSDHAAAINDNTTALANQTDTLKAQNDQLIETNQKLADVQESQGEIEQRLRDVASGEDGSSFPILGNMQANPDVRGELFNNTRYRLRIHNTTGSEQPLIVNGVQWTVRTDEWTYVPIPLGPVTIHRPGQEPLEVAEDHVQWQSDNRGFYVDYDLAQHAVSLPPEG